MKAKGQLRHHFWGTYACTIALIFECDVPMDAVIALLGDGWQPSENRPTTAVIGHGNGEWLDNVTETLVAWGAEKKAIASIAKSIDLGEPFECDVPLTHAVLAEQAGQQRLF